MTLVNVSPVQIGKSDMALDDLCLLDLVDVGHQIQAGKLTSVEVTEAVLDRIGRGAVTRTVVGRAT
jgi:hypothetical protein